MVGIKTTFAPATIAVATHDYHDECGNACAFDGAILVPSKAFWHLKTTASPPITSGNSSPRMLAIDDENRPYANDDPTDPYP